MDIFSPRFLLFWFCCLNFLNYIERGAIASNGVSGKYVDSRCPDEQCRGSDYNEPDDESKSCRDLCGYTGIQGEFNLTNLETGMLASFFTGGLTVACPISAQAVRKFHPFVIIGTGQFIFSLALLASGLESTCPNYVALLAYRTLLGVAEPSFIVVAPPMIDRFAPSESRTLWFALFYVCISVGSAGGFIFGMLFENTDWRWCFRVQAALNFPLALLFLLRRPERFEWENVENAADDDDEDLETTKELGTRRGESLEASVVKRASRNLGTTPLRGSVALSTRSSVVLAHPVKGRTLWMDVKELLGNNVYILILIAYTCMTAVSGVIVFWGPKAGAAIFNYEDADLGFGIMVVISGTLGTLAGGILLDRIGGGYVSACKICAVGMAVGGGLCTAGLWVPPDDPSLIAFFVLFSLGYFCVATLYGPVCAATMWVAPPDLRAQAMGFSTLAIHVFGDVPSPLYAGEIQDALENWQVTLTLITPLLGIASLFFWAATFLKPPKHIAADGERQRVLD